MFAPTVCASVLSDAVSVELMLVVVAITLALSCVAWETTAPDTVATLLLIVVPSVTVADDRLLMSPITLALSVLPELTMLVLRAVPSAAVADDTLMVLLATDALSVLPTLTTLVLMAVPRAAVADDRLTMPVVVLAFKSPTSCVSAPLKAEPSDAMAVDEAASASVVAVSRAATFELIVAPRVAVAVEASTTAALSVAAVLATFAFTLAVAVDCAVCSPVIMRPSSPPAGGPDTTGYIAEPTELAAFESVRHAGLLDAETEAVAEPLGEVTVSVRLLPACVLLGWRERVTGVVKSFNTHTHTHTHTHAHAWGRTAQRASGVTSETTYVSMACMLKRGGAASVAVDSTVAPALSESCTLTSGPVGV
jgi:hypothetical protein